MRVRINYIATINYMGTVMVPFFFSAILYCIGCKNSHKNSQLNTANNFASMMALKDSLTDFIKNDLGLLLSENYYCNWQENGNFNYYLYISKKDTIEAPSGFGAYRFLGTDTLKYCSIIEPFDEANYDFLLYKTTGTSATMLNDRLLTFRPEVFSFILLHEAMHVHLYKTQLANSLLYAQQEALCDITGNYGTVLLAKKYPSLINYSDALNQLDINEAIDSLINISIVQVNEKESQASIQNTYDMCYLQLKPLIDVMGDFHNDRYNYKINNAFLLRNSFYTSEYFNELDKCKVNNSQVSELNKLISIIQSNL